MRDGERGLLLATSIRAAEAETGQHPPHHPRVLRWPGLAIAAVIAAGVLDGAARADMGWGPASRTQRLSAARPRPESLLQVAGHGAADRGAAAASSAGLGGGERGGATRTEALRQKELGGKCTEHWNCEEWLVCQDGVCSSCESDSQCQERNPSRQCFSAMEGEISGNICKHKPLFFPLTWSDGAIGLITFVTSALAAPTGAGGGGILVPMYMIIGEFAAHTAVPLSKAAMFGGAIANNVINLQRRHPFANRPIIDFDAIQLLVPNLLAGTIFGVLLNAISPDWLLTIGLVIAMGYTGTSAAQKAWAMYNEEVRLEEREAQPEAQPLLGGKKSELPAKHYSFDTKDNLSADIYEIVDAESKTNFKALGVVAGAWVLVSTCSLFKGSSGTHGLVTCGSPEFFVIALLPVPIIMFLSWRVGLDVHERFERKRTVGFVFADGDTQWTLANVRLYALIAIVAGIGAGALGIAAGALLSPPLLWAGMHPLVTVATTGLIVLFTSSSTSVQYFILGRLQGDYALALIFIALLAAIVGNTLVNYVVRKYRKTWFVIALLAAIILLSTVLLGYTGIFRTMRAYDQGEDMGIRDLCNDRSHMLNEVDGDMEGMETEIHQFPWISPTGFF